MPGLAHCREVNLARLTHLLCTAGTRIVAEAVLYADDDPV